MPEELLQRVLREIRDRKRAARAACEESRRLEQALAALGPSSRSSPRDGDGAVRRRRSRPQGAPGEKEGGARTGRRARPRRSRAAPGANRERIVGLVRERPGVTAGEITEATGIARTTVTTTLRRLVDDGEVQRAQRPDGPPGFHAHDGELEPAAPSGPLTADAAASSAEGLPSAD
jgi:DNA-binding transcriptional ArsR family regulator